MISKSINKEAAHYILSVFCHLLIIAVVIFFNKDYYGGGSGGGFIQISPGMGQNSTKPVKPSVKPKTPTAPVTKKNEDDISDKVKETQNEPSQNVQPENSAGGLNGVSDLPADTTSLVQTYSEPTRNVTIKYPVGWTYLDQNVKNKLDGVTFWFSAGDMNPPPYIHLEVVEKYLFNEKNYKYNSPQGNYTFYYNDATEMAGQVSQVIYVRTNADEDYSIKLIINGWDAFSAFQPTFYGIIKSFKFGKSFPW